MALIFVSPLCSLLVFFFKWNFYVVRLAFFDTLQCCWQGAVEQDVSGEPSIHLWTNSHEVGQCMIFSLPLVFLADRTIGRAFGTLCRLSSSVTFFIVAKWYVQAKKCLKEWIGNQGQKVHFLGRRHISTSVLPLRPPRRPFLPYFCPYSPAIDTRWYKLTF